MNHIALIERNGNPRFDAVIDGRQLQEHFVGRRGAHPSQVFALGWKGARIDVRQDSLDQFLTRRARPARALEWSTYPEALQFDWIEYEGALAGLLLHD
jgi:hypothetical protein